MMQIRDTEKRILAALEDGLPLVAEPYAAVAETLGMAEQQVIAGIKTLIDKGVIRRHGLVVRHHALGFTSNGMTVWDIPDHLIDMVGKRLAALPFVTLCYQRPRRAQVWPYNLFAMVHGRDREKILEQVEEMKRVVGLDNIDHKVLFSTRQFKQRGARYSTARERVA